MQNLSQPFPRPVHASDEVRNQQTTAYGERQFAGEEPDRLHVINLGPFLEGHGPPSQWPLRLHSLDQTRELLPWGGGPTRPPQ